MNTPNNSTNIPPAPTGSTVSNWQIWMLAIFPPFAMMFGIGWIFGVITFFAGGYLDISNLRNAGYDPTPIKGTAWFPPVYLYKRCKFLGQSLAPFIVHLILWGVNMLWNMFTVLFVAAMIANS